MVKKEKVDLKNTQHQIHELQQKVLLGELERQEQTKKVLEKVDKLCDIGIRFFESFKKDV